ncbi:AAA family ATPase [Seohaeicola saemankumensis]|nr:AAA family ATPase [Seohaeicola saemankumensis]MCA0871487.1 AAA family ATPase [Seohaeicola saemankumensis]
MERVLSAPQKGRRKLVALAGPPASGKSTLAEVLASRLTNAGCSASVVGMDGFHLDNRVLLLRGISDRKGSPETFDVEGFLRLVPALRDAEQVYYPTFDREEDLARSAAGIIDAQCECVVIEGNYLLFDAPHWRDLVPHWDLTVRLDVPPKVLKQRLVQRWLDFGLPGDQAEKRAMANDMVNATMIATHALPASITV